MIKIDVNHETYHKDSIEKNKDLCPYREAENGYMDAQYNLVSLYYEGKGIERI